MRQKFTGKERDNETSLDYFLARYYSSTQGRFTSPDIPFVDQSEGDPQSWNLYAYVGNNPLKYIDPFGMWKRVSCGNGDCWEAEKDDTLETLSEQSGVRHDALQWAFGSFGINSGETVINVTGVEADHKAYLIDGLNQMPLFEPATGGGIIKRFGSPAAGGAISRAWAGLGNYFRKPPQPQPLQQLRTVEVIAKDGNAVHLAGQSSAGRIEVMANQRIEGGTLYLQKAHIEGGARGQFGPRELKEFMREYGRQMGVSRVVVEGATRTTGARPGHVPRPFVVEVN